MDELTWLLTADTLTRCLHSSDTPSNTPDAIPDHSMLNTDRSAIIPHHTELDADH